MRAMCIWGSGLKLKELLNILAPALLRLRLRWKSTAVLLLGFFLYIHNILVLFLVVRSVSYSYTRPSSELGAR